MTTRLDLSDRDAEMLSGEAGEGARVAMKIVGEMAKVSGAGRLIDISSAHIDSCLYHGRASLDFAHLLASAGAQVAVPTTLNVGAVDLLHPELFRGDEETAANARRLMDLYASMGCRPSWTCAPYQLAERPSFGEHIAWAESNAIVFANSVLGARTDRYGDFIDVCAAVTGRVPDAGLHRDENRRGQMVFSLKDLPESLVRQDVFYPVLGHLIGLVAGPRVPVIEGLSPSVTEDQLKALGAAAGSSGSVALFHAVGITPEAPTAEAALRHRRPERTVDVTLEMVASARDSLSTTRSGAIDAVSIGTPHFSISEFERLVDLLDGVAIHPDVEVYVSTGRGVLAEVATRGWLDACERAGVRVVVDTCTYITPIITGRRVVMTNSAKWAYYAPGNIGVDVVFGSLRECVESAVAGAVVRDRGLWGDA